MTTTHLWALIQEWRDAQFFPVSQAKLAEKIGITRSAMSQWKNGQVRPTPANLRELHKVTRIDYERLLDAVVRDMGYLDAEDGEGDGDAAPKNDAEGTSATGAGMPALAGGSGAPAEDASDAPGGSGSTREGIEWTQPRPHRRSTKGRPARGHKNDDRSGGRGTGGGDPR